MTFYNGDFDPAAPGTDNFQLTAGTSGVTLSAANVTYSNNGGTTYAYTPAAGYDSGGHPHPLRARRDHGGQFELHDQVSRARGVRTRGRTEGLRGRAEEFGQPRPIALQQSSILPASRSWK